MSLPAFERHKTNTGDTMTIEQHLEGLINNMQRQADYDLALSNEKVEVVERLKADVREAVQKLADIEAKRRAIQYGQPPVGPQHAHPGSAAAVANRFAPPAGGHIQ